jgi:hypothetical protein
MMTGVPAFEAAKANDRWYKLINMNRDDMFWKNKARSHKNMTFSENFKSLITLMW